GVRIPEAPPKIRRPRTLLWRAGLFCIEVTVCSAGVRGVVPCRACHAPAASSLRHPRTLPAHTSQPSGFSRDARQHLWREADGTTPARRVRVARGGGLALVRFAADRADQGIDAAGGRLGLGPGRLAVRLFFFLSFLLQFPLTLFELVVGLGH